ncbi:DNA-directed DNA polymerase [Tanacetum coccineum]
MRAFINEFRTTNELLFKERNNSLTELRFEVYKLLRVIDNALISNYEIKGVTARGGKKTQDVQNDNTNMHTEEPLVVNHDKPVEQKEVLVENKKTTKQLFNHQLRYKHRRFLSPEALAQTPKYTKFLKGLPTNKARLEEACTITMNERCSAVLLNKLQLKEKDTGSFTIPYDIGQLHIDNVLADLGASINRSIQYPRGIVENVLIKVDKFVLPIDFVILDMPEDSRVLIILGRPFLVTARAMIDVFNKKITLRVGDDEVIFNVDQLIKRPPNEDDECYGIDELDDTINMETQELLANDKSDSVLLKRLEKSINQSNLESCESLGNKSDDASDLKKPIRRID